MTILTLTSEQAALRDSCERFMRSRLPISVIRRRIDGIAAVDYRSYFTEAATLGFSSMLVADEHGGG